MLPALLRSRDNYVRFRHRRLKTHSARLGDILTPREHKFYYLLTYSEARNAYSGDLLLLQADRMQWRQKQALCLHLKCRIADGQTDDIITQRGRLHRAGRIIKTSVKPFAGCGPILPACHLTDYSYRTLKGEWLDSAGYWQYSVAMWVVARQCERLAVAPLTKCRLIGTSCISRRRHATLWDESSGTR